MYAKATNLNFDEIKDCTINEVQDNIQRGDMSTKVVSVSTRRDRRRKTVVMHKKKKRKNDNRQTCKLLHIFDCFLFSFW